MNNITFFCEGIVDQIFLADIIESLFEVEFIRRYDKKKRKLFVSDEKNKVKVVEVGGCDKLNKRIYLNELEDNSEFNIKNIVVFDADTKGKGNNGFESCKQKLETIKNNHDVDFEFYIWPDNQGDGIIENLLRDLIPLNMQSVIDCIESHKKCLCDLGIEGLKIPGIKEQISYYIHTCNLETANYKRSYKNDKYWNLHSSDSNSSIMKLHRFLKKHEHNNK